MPPPCRSGQSLGKQSHCVRWVVNLDGLQPLRVIHNLNNPKTAAGWVTQHYGWWVVLYSLVIQAVSVGILIYSFTLFAVSWQDEFKASRRDVMMTISCLQIGMGVLGPLVGRALDLHPTRYVVIIGAFSLALGLSVAHQASQLWHLWLVYATLMPMAATMMGTLASQTLVARWFSHQRGLAMGLSAMGTNLGGMIFPLLIAGWLIDLGWRDTFLQLAGVGLLLVVPLTLLVLRREPPSNAAAPVPQSAAARLQTIDSDRIWSAREILQTSRFWLPFLALVPLNMTFGALQFNLAHFAKDAGLVEGAAAQFVTIGALCMLMGKLFFGTLGDRVDHRVLFWIASAFMSAALLTLLFGHADFTLVLAVGFMGFAGGGILPLMGLIFGRLFGAASFGRVMGLVMLNVMLGALAPVAAGWVYDTTGDYDAAFWVLLVFIAQSMLAMLWLPKSSHHG